MVFNKFSKGSEQYITKKFLKLKLQKIKIKNKLIYLILKKKKKKKIKSVVINILNNFIIY